MTVCLPAWLLATVASFLAGPAAIRAWRRLNGES